MTPHAKSAATWLGAASVICLASACGPHSGASSAYTDQGSGGATTPADNGGSSSDPTEALQGAAGSGGSAGTAQDSGEATAGAPMGGAASGGSGEGGSATGGSGAVASAGASGASGELPDPDSCREFTCPDEWTCELRQEDQGCVRACALANGEPYLVFDEPSVANLSALECDVLDGTLWLYGTDIQNVIGLETIREITGELLVRQAAPDSLEGLENLETVGALEIEARMRSIELPALRSVSGNLYVFYQSGATEIRLPKLETAGELAIDASTSVVTVDLPSLTSVESLDISDNEALVTLSGLPALQSATRVRIQNNPMLPQCEVNAIEARVGCDACDENGPLGACE